jgi:hypothetical protein
MFMWLPSCAPRLSHTRFFALPGAGAAVVEK